MRSPLRAASAAFFSMRGAPCNGPENDSGTAGWSDFAQSVRRFPAAATGMQLALYLLLYPRHRFDAYIESGLKN
jgi:hypothetical protein